MTPPVEPLAVTNAAPDASGGVTIGNGSNSIRVTPDSVAASGAGVLAGNSQAVYRDPIRAWPRSCNRPRTTRRSLGRMRRPQRWDSHRALRHGRQLRERDFANNVRLAHRRHHCLWLELGVPKAATGARGTANSVCIRRK